MHRKNASRLVALVFLLVLTLGTVGCNATVGVGVGVPIYGGWGPYAGGMRPYGGVYFGGPVWP